MKVNRYTKRAIFSVIGKHCTFSQPHDFIEVTKWHNEEGYDIEIASNLNNSIMRMTEGQFNLLKKLIRKLDNET